MIFVSCRSCRQQVIAHNKSKLFCEECAYQRRAISRRLRDKSPLAQKRYKRFRNSEKYREYSRNRYHTMDENVRKARYYLRNALREGRLIKSSVCEHCGATDYGTKRSMIEGHHYLGYDKKHWFDVQWLCVTCHKIADKNEKDLYQK